MSARVFARWWPVVPTRGPRREDNFAPVELFAIGIDPHGRAAPPENTTEIAARGIADFAIAQGCRFGLADATGVWRTVTRETALRATRST